MRLSKLIDVQWRTAYAMLRRLRIAMGHRDSRYRLTDLIEVDDAYLGANKTGKANRGGGRTPILVAIEKTEEGKPGFVAIEALASLSKSGFVYRFNRRFWEPQIPNRLLRLSVGFSRNHPWKECRNHGLSF